MKKTHLTTLLATVVVAAGSGLFLDSIGHTRKSPPQDVEKKLEIQRHANEPLELVDLMVSQKSVKSKIKVKYRNADEGKEGLDKVEFEDTDEWFKRVRIRLRNVSGISIIGLRVYLYFQPPPTKTLFRVELTNPRQLQSEPLETGAEIDLAVEDQSWKQTKGILDQYGADANLAAVTHSIDIVAFSDGSQWHRGHILRRDPNNPNRWIPTGKVSP